MSIAAQHLSVRLGGQLVLDRLDCRFETGWTALVGPNGAGKSTLLKCLAGLLPLEQGRVLAGGEDLSGLLPPQRARLLAWLPQHAPETSDLTVEETVALGRIAHMGLFGALTADDEAAVLEALRRTDCLDVRKEPLQVLSGGQRQRVMIARVLATGAPVLLLDEPTTHVDPPHQVALTALLRELGRTHTVVSVMHDLALSLQADRVVLLAQGRIAAQGSRDDAHLHRALEAVFDQAIRIGEIDGRFLPVPSLPLNEDEGGGCAISDGHRPQSKS